MNLEYRSLLPENFSDKSKVWIYQSSRLFTLAEVLEIEEKLAGFTQNWLSHGEKVKAYGNLFFGQFIVLMADEMQTTVGGCSTDESQRFIKSIEQHYNVELLNRTTLAFLVKDKIQLLPMSQLQYAFENGFIDGDSLYFNNLANTKYELEHQWIIPVKESWMAARLPVKA